MTARDDDACRVKRKAAPGGARCDTPLYRGIRKGDAGPVTGPWGRSGSSCPTPTGLSSSFRSPSATWSAVSPRIYRCSPSSKTSPSQYVTYKDIKLSSSPVPAPGHPARPRPRRPGDPARWIVRPAGGRGGSSPRPASRQPVSRRCDASRGGREQWIRVFIARKSSRSTMAGGETRPVDGILKVGSAGHPGRLIVDEPQPDRREASG